MNVKKHGFLNFYLGNKKRVYMLTILLAFILISQTGFTKSDLSKTISIKLEYKSGSVWDSDDDGIESDKAAIDFTVENTLFSWDADESKLCTKWEVYSINNEKATTLCYGNNRCCNLINLAPENPKWNDVLFLQYGKYGASM